MHASGKKNQWWQCLIEFIKFGKKGKEEGWSGVLPANTPGAGGICDTDFRERLRDQRRAKHPSHSDVWAREVL